MKKEFHLTLHLGGEKIYKFVAENVKIENSQVLPQKTSGDNFLHLYVCSDDGGHVQELNKEPARASGVSAEWQTLGHPSGQVGQTVQN